MIRLRIILAALAVLILVAVPTSAQIGDKQVLYYRDPSGKPDYSPVPKQNALGADYLPVYDEDEVAPPPAPAVPRGKILYYRNPMGLADTSPVPKKDPMGMAYVPVYAGDEPDDSGVVKLSVAKVQRLGVRTERAAPRVMTRVVHATGTIQPDERRLTVFSTRFEGWIETLHVNATGQSVHRGDPLMTVYAPDLVAAQQEYLLSGRTLRASGDADAKSGVQGLVDAGRRRLLNLGFTDEQFQTLQKTGVMRSVTLRAPADGVVLEKTAIEGMRFMAGDPLYRMADMSSMWLIAEVFEQDLAGVREGEVAAATMVAWPGEIFDGVVTFIYPSVSRETRTTKVRIELPNPGGHLKIDMFAEVELRAPSAAAVLAVPDSAVLDTGARQAVLIDRGEGRFEPRAVTLGQRADGYVAVSSGLRDGDLVVVGANFLIDAESNMKAALRAFTADSPK